MAAAFVTSLTLEKFYDSSQPREFALLLLITVGITTVVWLSVTFLTSPEPRATLLSFYRRVRPSAAMWGPVAREATDVVPQRDGLFNLVDWLCGVAMIYAFLFGTGHLIFGETTLGVSFILGGIVLGAVIYRDLNKRGWETLAR
jgi:SSS family solute:Na+ symporter